MSRVHREVSIHAPIRLSVEDLDRGDLVERICELVDTLVTTGSHVAWVEVRENQRKEDGSSKLTIWLHRCCEHRYGSDALEYLVHKIEAGRYRLERNQTS